MARFFTINGLVCLIYVLLAWSDVAHAYEHEDESHASDECEICFIITQSTDDALVDKTSDGHIDCCLYQAISYSSTLLTTELLSAQARAPPY